MPLSANPRSILYELAEVTTTRERDEYFWVIRNNLEILGDSSGQTEIEAWADAVVHLANQAFFNHSIRN